MNWNGWCISLLLLPASIAIAAPASKDVKLVTAVQNQDHDAVQTLLKQHVDVNQAQEDGATALAWAAHWDDLSTAEFLIRAGANVNAANDLGVTPLSLAATNGNPDMTEKLLKAGANPNAALSTGETVLMTAARTGNVQVIKALLARGAKVNLKEAKHAQTALMWAAAQKHPEAVRVLLQGGAEVDARSSSGFTALLFAAREGDLESARLLVAAKANVNAVSAEGITPLMAASAGVVALAANEYRLTITPSDHEAVAIFLLEKGADAQPADRLGRTALHEAAETGKVELAKALIAHQANPNARIQVAPPPLRGDYVTRAGFVGATPFWLAARNGHAEVMRVLVAGGADPGLPATGDCPFGTKVCISATPLMMAVGFGQIEIRLPPENRALDAVQVAVKAGANVNAANEAGQTALHVAATLGKTTIVQFLAESGAKLDAKDKQGRTPLNLAEDPKRPRPATAALLRKLSSDPKETPQ
jgi:ankyrin repeat protein